jgi:hypothetical protein
VKYYGVVGAPVKDLAGDFTLHVALIENEVTYSGENGLRFHLDEISAENLRYYDEWPVERNKEVNARMPSFRSGVPEVNSPPTGK